MKVIVLLVVLFAGCAWTRVFHPLFNDFRVGVKEVRSLATLSAHKQGSEISPSPVSTCGESTCNDLNYCPQWPNANSMCINGQCQYNALYYGQYNVCSSVDQCGTGACLCPTSLSPGCKCDPSGPTTVCTTTACMGHPYNSQTNGTCEWADGSIGEACNEYNTCNAGACSANGTCEWIQKGEICTIPPWGWTQPCAPGYACTNISSTTSVCMAKKGDICSSVYSPQNFSNCFSDCTCPTGSVCDMNIGICAFIVEEGEQCYFPQNQVSEIMCNAGLSCIPNNKGVYTCQPVAVGTPCNPDSQTGCALLTQECACVVPSNDVPAQCVDQAGLCTDIMAATLKCIYQYCDNYDVEYDNGSPCYQKCNPLYVDLGCCMSCMYPANDNSSIPNFSGNCAAGTLASVQCCNTQAPCALLSMVDMCTGYPGYVPF